MIKHIIFFPAAETQTYHPVELHSSYTMSVGTMPNTTQPLVLILVQVINLSTAKLAMHTDTTHFKCLAKKNTPNNSLHKMCCEIKECLFQWVINKSNKKNSPYWNIHRQSSLHVTSGSDFYFLPSGILALGYVFNSEIFF